MEEFTLSDEKNSDFRKNWNLINGLGFRFKTALDDIEFEFLKIIDSKIIETIRKKGKNIEFLYLLRLIISTRDGFELIQSLKLLLSIIDHLIPQQHINVTQG